MKSEVAQDEGLWEPLLRLMNGFRFLRINVLASELSLDHSSSVNLLSTFFSDTPLHDVIFFSFVLVSLVPTLDTTRFPLLCLDVMAFELIAVRKYAAQSL